MCVGFDGYGGSELYVIVFVGSGEGEGWGGGWWQCWISDLAYFLSNIAAWSTHTAGVLSDRIAQFIKALLKFHIYQTF